MMDFSGILRGVLPTAEAAANLTGAARVNMTPKPPSAAGDQVMQSLLPLMGRQFMPLFSALGGVHELVGTHLGIDPTMVLTVLGFIWALNRVVRQLYGVIFLFVQDNFTCKIHIASTDEMYLHLMKWLAVQPGMTNSRDLTAETVSKTAWEEEEQEAVLDVQTISPDGQGIYLNFSNHEKKAVSPPSR